jgi:hypothetical protein
MNNQAGKGSKPRPIVKSIFDSNFDEIIWKRDVETESQIVKIKNKKVKRFIYK